MKTLLAGASLLVAVGSITIACGSGTGEVPLGGPYGGNGEYAAPGDVGSDAGAGATGEGGGGEGSGGAGGTAGAAGASGATGAGGSGITGAAGSSGSSGSAGASGSAGTAGSKGSAGSHGSGGSAGSGGAGGSGGKGVDSGPPAPTWTTIYADYVASGTIGNCGSHCHSEMTSASAAYSYLSEKNQISGTSSDIVNPKYSLMSWFGGNMPPGGPRTEAKATADMEAWVAAGALDN